MQLSDIVMYFLWQSAICIDAFWILIYKLLHLNHKQISYLSPKHFLNINIFHIFKKFLSWAVTFLLVVLLFLNLNSNHFYKVLLYFTVFSLVYCRVTWIYFFCFVLPLNTGVCQHDSFTFVFTNKSIFYIVLGVGSFSFHVKRPNKHILFLPPLK